MTKLAASMAVACLLLLALTVQAAPPPDRDLSSLPAPPAATEILKTLRPGHPRLLASADDFAQLRQRIWQDPQLQQWYQKIKARADKMLGEPPSIYELPDGVRLLPISRRVLERVQTLALVYQLDGNQAYADRLWRELDAVAHFPSWHPAHFLDTAEMTHAVALGYDWLYDKWTPEQRETLRTAIVNFGLRPALACYRGKSAAGWWAKANNNWNQVCNGGIGMGALAIADEEPALAREILANAVKNIPLAMIQYAPDGAWAEGPGYWDYATTYTCTFLAALDSALGQDFGLSQVRGFANAGQFPIYACGPTGKSFNYADAHEGPIHAPAMLWLARQFNRPEYARFERANAEPVAMDLLWYDAALANGAAAPPPLDMYFHNVDVLTFRSAWDNRTSLFVAIKAGDNKSNHSHLDLGTFVLDALGERFAMLAGSDSYVLPGYFGAQRWTYYRLRAEGNNTLVIDPTQAPDQDPRAAGSVISFVDEPTGSPFACRATLDLTPAYAGHHATSVHRTVAMPSDRLSVVIADQVETDQPVDMWWFMHTTAAINIPAGGNRAILTLHGKTLVAEISSSAPANFVAMDATPLPTSPNPKGQNPNKGIRKLAIHVAPATSVRLMVWLTPENRGGAMPYRPDQTAIANLFEAQPMR